MLETIQAALALLAKHQDAAHKAETVALRRQLAQQLGMPGDAERAAMDTPANQQLNTNYRRRLSAMRPAIAFHQSEWPAVSLDDAPDA